MLNENKIKMMTKMAIYEKNEGKTMLKTAKYFKTDFVTLGVLKTIVAATIAFLVLIVLYALCRMDFLLENVNSIDYIEYGKQIALYYIIFISVFAVISGVVYAYQYEHSRKDMKKYFSRLSKLERFYNSQKKKK